MNFHALLTTTSNAAAGTTDNTYAILMQVGMFAVIIVAFYFLLIRPQRKREKATQEMRNSISVGDQVTTIGGVVGRVVSIKDDTITVETGSDKVKIRFVKSAIQSKESNVSE